MNFRFSIPFWLLAGILLSASWSRADDPPPRRHMENRFLFVIDTSSAMKVRAQGVAEAVNGILASGMKGEARKGDTIGLWTYSDQLDTDFPMEVWSDEKKDSLCREVREHLDHLRYQKRAHLEKALPTILHVAQDSERLTVIFIFDGSELIKGTPFDKDINDLHKHYAREFRTAESPFVTILTARDGRFFDYTINYPGTVLIPHTADPLPPPAETNQPPSVASSAAPPIEPTPQTPRTNVQIILSGSDFAHNTSPPPPIASNATAAAAPAPTQLPVVAGNVAPPVETAPIATQTAQSNAALPQPSRLPPPVVASSPALSPLVTNPAKPAVAVPATVATVPVPPPSTSKPSVPAAPAVIAATTSQLTAMFIIAFSLLTIAVVMVLLLVRRWRGGPRPSLISQSIDRSR